MNNGCVGMLIRSISRRIGGISSPTALIGFARKWTTASRDHHCHSNVRPSPCAKTSSSSGISQRLKLEQRRSLLTGNVPPILVPPVVFFGLLLLLWAYKCFMTVAFQDRIIYMPYMPPFARYEKLEDYTAACKPVEWEEKQIRSLDDTKISLAVGHMPEDRKTSSGEGGKKIVVCYFQGNGSSPPPRLPLLSQVLKLVHNHGPESVHFTIIALSYRGYWTSSGRASQKGIELDAQAMLQWVAKTYPTAALVLWGQSVGAGVASTAAASYIHSSSGVDSRAIIGLIMETPFTSIKSMLFALYPQKWLPYQYLHPFLWNHWDSEVALRRIADSHVRRPKLLLMPATRDEVVPAEEIEKLEGVCKELSLTYERRNIIGALHTEATTRREGQDGVAKFLLSLSEERPHR